MTDIFKILPSWFIIAFLMNQPTGARSEITPAPAAGTSEKSKAQGASIHSPSPGLPMDEIKLQKELLDLARRGVAIIHVKTYASALSSHYERDGKHFATGFIVDKAKGLIATNRHVVGEMSVSTYELKLSDGTTLPAQLAYFDPVYDFAFLKVDPQKLPSNTIQLEFSEKPVSVNEEIFSLGNSAGDEFSMISGTVFNVYHSFGPFPEQTFQYAGLTLGGASGSPVFNIQGKVVGIIYGGRFVSGAALPAAYIQDALTALRQEKIPHRKEVGAMMKYMNIDELLDAKLIGLEFVKHYIQSFPQASKKILCVESPIVGTPGYEHLRAGDILWKVNGALVGPDLYALIQKVNQSNGPMIWEIFRNGQLMSVSLDFSSYDLSPYLRFVSFAGATFFQDSLHTRLFTGDQAPGVFISSITPSSAFASLKGQESGWWGEKSYTKILEINGKSVKSLQDLLTIIPPLHKEKRVEIRYIKMSGVSSFGDQVITDRLERFTTVQYDSSFDSPKEYVFDQKLMKWQSHPIQMSS